MYHMPSLCRVARILVCSSSQSISSKEREPAYGAERAPCAFQNHYLFSYCCDDVHTVVWSTINAPQNRQTGGKSELSGSSYLPCFDVLFLICWRALAAVRCEVPAIIPHPSRRQSDLTYRLRINSLTFCPLF